eukprot:scaffold77957_cov68-Phaeocystis_antarctica.AAC.4
MRMLLCSLLLATRAAGLSTRLAQPRVTARSELLDLLRPSASVAPLPVTGRVAELVDELELNAVLPETPAFLAFGLNGRWQLRALLGPDGLELPAAGLPLACLSPAAAHQLPHHAASQALEHRGANPSPSPSPSPNPSPNLHRRRPASRRRRPGRERAALRPRPDDARWRAVRPARQLDRLQPSRGRDRAARGPAAE